MKEIKLWKMALIWFGTLFLAVFFTELYSIFTFSDVSDVILIFNTFSTTLLFTLLAGRVNYKLIRERFNHFKQIVNKKEVLIVVTTQIFLSSGISYLSLGILASTDKNKALEVLNDFFGNPTNNMEFVLWFLSIVILAPILEEIVFRRVIFKRLNIRFGFLISSVLSSLVFGVGHDFLGIIGAIIFGIAACLLYVKYNNLLVPITIHFLNNLIAGVLAAFTYFDGSMNEVTKFITDSDIKLYLIIGISLTLVTIIVFIKFIIINKSYIKTNKKTLEQY